MKKDDGRANGKLEKFHLNYIHVFMEQAEEPELLFSDVYRRFQQQHNFYL